MTKAAGRTTKPTPKPTPKATRPVPKRVAEETIAEMKRLADPKRAAGNQRYFKEPIASYGLDGPTAKGLIKELITQTKGVWTVGDAVAFCNLLVRDPNLEPRGIAYQLVAAFVKDADASLLDDVRGWLEKSCGNWALVDNLAPSVLAPLLERHPKLVPEVVGWTTSRNMWLRRASAVTFIPLVQHGQHLDTAYDVATRLFDDTEDLMHKAVGWMLREAGKKDMPRLERFLKDQGPRMPRTTRPLRHRALPGREEEDPPGSHAGVGFGRLTRSEPNEALAKVATHVDDYVDVARGLSYEDAERARGPERDERVVGACLAGRIVERRDEWLRCSLRKQCQVARRRGRRHGDVDRDGRGSLRNATATGDRYAGRRASVEGPAPSERGLPRVEETAGSEREEFCRAPPLPDSCRVQGREKNLRLPRVYGQSVYIAVRRKPVVGGSPGACAVVGPEHTAVRPCVESRRMGGVHHQSPDQQGRQACVGRGPRATAVVGLEDTARRSCVEDRGVGGIHRQSEDRQVRQACVDRGPRAGRVDGPEDPSGRPGIERRGCYRIDGQAPDVEIRQARVGKGPEASGIGGLEDPARADAHIEGSGGCGVRRSGCWPTSSANPHWRGCQLPPAFVDLKTPSWPCACVERGGSHRVDGEGRDASTREAGIGSGPGAARIGGSEDPANSPGVDRGRHEGVDGDGVDQQVPDAGAGTGPVGRGVGGLEHARSGCPGVYRAGSRRMNGQGDNPQHRKARVDGGPTVAGIGGLEDTTTPCAHVDRGRRCGIDGNHIRLHVR